MLKPLHMRRRINTTLQTPAGGVLFSLTLCGFPEEHARRMGTYLAVHHPDLKPEQIGAIVALSLHTSEITLPKGKPQKVTTLQDRDKLADLLVQIALQQPEKLEALYSSLGRKN